MTKSFNILIVENQELIIDSFKMALAAISEKKGLTFNITEALDCEMAKIEIEKIDEGIPLDLLMINIGIPSMHTKKLLFPDDLAVGLREKSPETKIMAFTSNCDNYRLYNIFKLANPEGVASNADLDFKELEHALNTVLFDPPYYSNSIVSYMRLCVTNDVLLQQKDREILYHLSKGANTRELAL